MAALPSTPFPAAEALARLIWRGDRLAAPVAPGLPTGHAALDAELPGCGWPAGALTELLVPHAGVGELGLLLPLLGRVPAGRRAVCIAPPGLPYAPALAAAGVPLGRLLFVHPEGPAHARWATRQALNSRCCEVVVLWLAEADPAALRRLQLAAEEGATPLILIRPQKFARHPSPAALRLALSARPGGVAVQLLKRRGPPLAAPLLIDLPWRSATLRPGSALPHSPPCSSLHAVVRPLPARSGPAGLHAGAQ